MRRAISRQTQVGIEGWPHTVGFPEVRTVCDRCLSLPVPAHVYPLSQQRTSWSRRLLPWETLIPLSTDEPRGVRPQESPYRPPHPPPSSAVAAKMTSRRKAADDVVARVKEHGHQLPCTTMPFCPGRCAPRPSVGDLRGECGGGSNGSAPRTTKHGCRSGEDPALPVPR